MADIIPSSYIYLARPDLIKEWHPTKNGKLNPRNVTCDHGEEVWWLCERGHEWKGTVNSKMLGDRCPVCATELFNEPPQKIEPYRQQFSSNNEHASEEMNDPSQEDSNMDYEGFENRKYKRYKYIAAALLEDLVSENRVYAQMQNISYKGMYFETSASLTTGGKVRIKLDKPLFKSKSKLSKSGVSTVRWCKKLFDEEGYVYAYGLGVQVDAPFNNSL